MNAKEFNVLKRELSENNVQLIAVSKTKPIDRMRKVESWGHSIFGENRIEEINRKAPLLPEFYQWHLIGPLQSRKIKTLQTNITLIQAVDREKILWGLERHFQELNHVQDILLQVHIAEEESKHGFNLEQVEKIMSSNEFLQMKHVRVRGLMGMATFTPDKEQIKAEFLSLRHIYEHMKTTDELDQFNILSMGMSGDYKLAIDCGSNMVRIGSKIFGPR